MSMKHLQNRVDRIASQVPQERYLEVLKDIPEDSRKWGEMPSDQWFHFSLWMHLYRALKEQDQPRIAGYRYRLSFTDEQVREMFCSLAAPGETDQTLHRYFNIFNTIKRRKSRRCSLISYTQNARPGPDRRELETCTTDG